MLIAAEHLLSEYVQEFSKNHDGSEKNEQSTTISQKEEQRIAEAEEAFKSVHDAVVVIKTRILDPALFHRMVASGGPGDDDNLRRALENEIDDFYQKIENPLILTDDQGFAADLRELSRLSRLIFHSIKHADSHSDSGRPVVDQQIDALERIDEHTKNCLTWLSLANAISSHIENKAFGIKATQRKEGGSVEGPLRGETD